MEERSNQIARMNSIGHAIEFWKLNKTEGIQTDITVIIKTAKRYEEYIKTGE